MSVPADTPDAERTDWLLALAASGLREAGCPHDLSYRTRECRARKGYSRMSWCRRCRTLDRLEALGFVEPTRPPTKGDTT